MTLTAGNRITERKTCSQFYIVHHKFNMNWPGSEHSVLGLISGLYVWDLLSVFPHYDQWLSIRYNVLILTFWGLGSSNVGLLQCSLKITIGFLLLSIRHGFLLHKLLCQKICFSYFCYFTILKGVVFYKHTSCIHYIFSYLIS